MIREQAVLKLPHTEIPIRVFDEPGFWVLLVIVSGIALVFAMLWRRK